MADRITVVQGDLTQQKVDAIVNAANQQLLPGGGVCGAIHRAAGPELEAECRQLAPCPTGEGRITRGYRLEAAHVIHVVGPVWQGGEQGEPVLLAACYRNGLALAAENGLSTVAFPAISTGIFGYPLEAATLIAIQTVAEELGHHPSIREVRLVTFGDEATETAERLLRERD